MTDIEQERELRERELEFFSHITASVSHELNNAIAIIEQAAGLLEDLIATCDENNPPSKEMIRRVMEKIGRQTARGAQLIKKMNLFAHSVDDPEKDLELNALTENIFSLSRRLAERRRVKLEFHPAASPVSFRGSSFRVQHAVFLSIERAMFEGTERVVISTSQDDSSAKVTVASQPAEATIEPDLSYLELLMAQIGGEVSSSMGSELSIELTFPVNF